MLTLGGRVEADKFVYLGIYLVLCTSSNIELCV